MDAEQTGSIPPPPGGQPPEENVAATPFFVVGVGASAGGLEAFLELLGALPADTGMAFVLVQHLEPTHESQLVGILAQSSKMPVIQAAEAQAVERNHVYVIPPNNVMQIRGRVLHLAPRRDSPRPNYPIDVFFEALAMDQGACAIGVVLSGSASDGAHGIRSIKANGGVTFAQDERSAKYGGMPHSAIATGAVDFVLSPASIASELMRIDSRLYLVTRPQHLDDLLGEAQDSEFVAVLERLRAATQIDFSQYKQSTIRRRLSRRLVVHHLKDLHEYLDFLDSHRGEIYDLYRDLLISVTAFFREPGTFLALERSIQEYVVARGGSDAFRIWVPGCATGEEVYSLAMLVVEILQRAGKAIPIQVFGTDISDSAIEKARHGVYSEHAVQELSPERQHRFFTHTDAGYRIRQQIRDCCIFAKHDLTSDPPFSQMDLVSCRNVFIYMSAGLQHRVLPSLHYSLRLGGMLVLGSAETVGNRADLFEIVNHDQNIYVKKAGPANLAMELKPSSRIVPPLAASLFETPGLPIPTLMDLENRGARILRDLYAPSGVLVNADLQILHSHGNTGFYLDQAPPENSVNLLRIAREELVTPLRRAVSSALAQKQPVQEPPVEVRHQNETRKVRVSVMPLTDEGQACLVLFEDDAPTRRFAKAGPAREPREAEIELSYAQRELAQTRDYLRKVIEQNEATNEELRSANEEARSTNEELQSTNEELRTAKELLQSANEELTTVNEELQNRLRELSLATNDLSNILSAATIPIVMVGMDLRLRRFTPAAQSVLGLTAADLGRPISDLRHAAHVAGLGDRVQETLRTLAVQQERIQDRAGCWYELYIRPYRTLDERIDGAVITFIDVDQTARALEQAEQARLFADAIVETVQHPLLIVDSNLRVKRATASFYKAFGVRPDETLGREIDVLGNGQWNIPELRRLLDLALVRDVPFRDFEVTHEFSHLGKRIMRLNARRVQTGSSDYSLLVAIEDVTERQESAEIQYRRLFESAKDGIIVIDGDCGEVVDVNPYFLEMSRYPLAELLGKKFRDLPPFLDEKEMRSLVPATIEKGTTRYESVELRGRDGRECIVEMIANTYRIKEQGYIQINIRDVTERRHNESRLRSANLDLQQFAFAASHDLQEPLRTIMAYLELLKRDYHGKLGEDADRYIGFIISSAERMRQLVLDLLGYSQVVRADMQVTEVSVEAALATAMMNLQLAIQGSNAAITFDALPVVRMDETRLVQLLQNLIGNSIKYRSEAEPLIHISVREAGPEWIFSVRDNGIGLDMTFADQIFAVFKRLQGREYPGTGVGLAICKKIVERRGGRIWVESIPDRGSTFYFTVPKE